MLSFTERKKNSHLTKFWYSTLKPCVSVARIPTDDLLECPHSHLGAFYPLPGHLSINFCALS